MEFKEFKDFLPMVGIAIGWFLNEASAHGKRVIEKKKALGRATSVLYFLCLEMVQIKIAQESMKNMSTDVKEWEKYRRHSFEKHANADPEFAKQIETSVNAVAEYYPVEAYHLREIVAKYQFYKGKSLEPFVENEDLYVKMLSAYELAYMAHQHQLEKIVRFLAFRQSTITWIRIASHFRDMRKRISGKDPVFFDQIKKAVKEQKRRSGEKSDSTDKPEQEPTE